jgi:peptidoglycan/LPS O-acetylase OafA/YrhL
MRLIELVLLLAPFALFLAWRLTLPVRGPSLQQIVLIAAAIVVMAGALVLLQHEEAKPPTAAYIPSHVQDGRIIPSTEAPR